MAFQLFGYEILKKKPASNMPKLPVTPMVDGSTVVNSANMSGWYGISLDIDGTVRNEVQMINRYREISTYPDCDTAIEQIVNEAVIVSEARKPVELNLDQLPDNYNDEIKESIREHFDKILGIINFNENCHDIFKRWYVDGRLYYYVVVDAKHPTKGILDMKYVDPRKIRKVTEYQKEMEDGVEVIKDVKEYYVFNDNGLENASQGIRLSTDSIINVKSGLVDANSGEVISHLYKAIKPVNQLKMMEDALVIYRITRAPERRVFYVDVGNLPAQKAEQYVSNIMSKFRNKVVYDAETGEVKNNRNYMSMCLAMDTKVPLLDGRTLTIAEIAEQYRDKDLWAYSCDPETGKFYPGLITWAGYTRKNQQVMRITLDNGKSITCTLDHKFPIREGGFVEAKDLVVGQSLMPFYTRKKQIGNSNEYLQIFQNDTNKWGYVHRLVSDWKESVGMDNRTVFDENIKGKYDVVHHRNFNRFDNSPSNLTLVDEKDHLQYHNGYSYGREVLAEKMKDPEFNAWFREQQRKGWTEEKRLVASENAKKMNLSMLGNQKLSELFADSRYVEERNKRYATEYSENIFEVVKACASEDMTVAQTIVKLNGSEDIIKEFGSLNSNKCISPKQKKYDRFCKEDVYRIVKRYSEFNTYGELKESYRNHNHKIVSIEMLDEKMDVGCLTIDGLEKYHSHHTFATDAGVYVKNCEDFWLPRREGGKATEITTLAGGQNLGEIEDIVFFQNKLYQALNVPKQRLLADNLFNIGTTAEITREEVLFSKFIQRLRNNFNTLFKEALRIELICSRVISAKDWNDIHNKIFFDYQQDNYFEEMKRIELLNERMTQVQNADAFRGTYFSREWIVKNILQLGDEEWNDIKEQIALENAEENGDIVDVGDLSVEDDIVDDAEDEKSDDFVETDDSETELERSEKENKKKPPRIVKQTTNPDELDDTIDTDFEVNSDETPMTRKAEKGLVVVNNNA